MTVGDVFSNVLSQLTPNNSKLKLPLIVLAVDLVNQNLTLLVKRFQQYLFWLNQYQFMPFGRFKQHDSA